MYDGIPHEMRSFKQWICWRLVERENAKPTKVPIQPGSGYTADVTNPAHWDTFENAVSGVARHGCSGIGFVLTREDPYGFIDLDDTHGDAASYDRQLRVFHSFSSYSEISPGGNGLHIIVKGAIPKGRRRSDIEIYSSERYMTMTGNVYLDKPIEERNYLLNLLFEEMGEAPVIHTYGAEGSPQTATDEQVLETAKSASNGDKFAALYAGQWADYYKSQSEADFALIDILAFYTQNRDQIVRLFHSSALGQRRKAYRPGYYSWMVDKSFDRQLPPIDIDGLRIKGEEAFRQAPGGEPGSTPPEAVSIEPEATKQTTGERRDLNTASFPPGLVGEIASFILEASPRPVPEIALTGAISLVSGITGRAYNVSGTGLNQYILLIANTGSGKDALSSGIDKLMTLVYPSVPAAREFKGPGELVSSAGLIKWLGKTPAVLSVIGEFGLKLREMSNPSANAHLASVKRLFLQLYSKSGRGNHLDPMAYSDQQKNTNAIYSPSLTLLGESTPETFYENLDERMVADGLLPRFLIVEYRGKVPYLSEHHKDARPSFALVERLGALCAECLSRQQQNEPKTVNLNADADAIFKQFGNFATDKVNETKLEVTRQLWNRAHIKALKLAAVIAVGINYLEPVITVHEANYAINIVVAEVENMIDRFSNGDVGLMTNHNVDEFRQIKELGRQIAVWIDPKDKTHTSYKLSHALKADNVITYNALQMKMYPNKLFKNDRLGPAFAIKRALQYFVDAGVMQEVPRGQMSSRYHTIAKAWCVTDPAHFAEYSKSQ